MSQHYSYIQPLSWYEAEIKGSRKYFVEGYISTIDKDSYNEVVTMNAQHEILAQVKGKIITIDVGHEEFVDDRGNVLARPKAVHIPVAKIVEAELKDKGVWVKAELNADSGRFDQIWNNIKNQFLHAFSIGYVPLKSIMREVNGEVIRFIDSLNILNVTFTGVPVNHNATFTPSMKAALKNMVTQNMTDQTTEPKSTEPAQQTTAPAATPAPESTTAPAPNSGNDSIAQVIKDLNEKIETQNKVLAKQNEQIEKFLQAHEKPSAPTAPQGQPLTPPYSDGPLASIKSLAGKLKENEEYINRTQKFLEAPVLKSFLEKENVANKYKEQKEKLPLDVIQ